MTSLHGATTTKFSTCGRPRVVVLGSGFRPHIPAEAARLRPHIEQHAEIVAWDLAFAEDLSRVEADAAIVLGGDGSILRSALQMGRRQLPVLAVNLGKLGFLADLTPDELIAVLPNLPRAGLPIVHHLMFECRVSRGEKTIVDQLGLNEVVLHGGEPFHLIDIHLYVDGELATTYSSDGVIVSTPVGSTAHNLAAGGPIVRKDLQAFVISPLNPHTLTNRPVIDLANRVYELVVPKPNSGTACVVDGRVRCHVEPGDRIRIESASTTFQLIQVPGHGYYRTLREKLGWGGRLKPV